MTQLYSEAESKEQYLERRYAVAQEDASKLKSTGLNTFGSIKNIPSGALRLCECCKSSSSFEVDVLEESSRQNIESSWTLQTPRRFMLLRMELGRASATFIRRS